MTVLAYGGRSLRIAGPTPWLEVASIPAPDPASGPLHPVTPGVLGFLPSVLPFLLDPVEPDEAERAAWDGATLPASRAYTVLDGARVQFLPDLLETSGMHYRCLFTGRAAEDYREAAPYLVQLDRDNAFSRRLLTPEAEGGLWEQHAGFFVRTRQPLSGLWSHLRKFTRLQDHAGQWFFNRFWAPSVSTTLLELGADAALTPYVSPMFPSGRASICILTVSEFSSSVLSRSPGTEPSPARPVLTKDVMDWMRHIRRVQEFDKLIDIALRHVRKKMPMDTALAYTRLRALRDMFFAMGFWRRDHLTRLCVWELMLGPEFLNTYADGQIKQIVRRSTSDWDAINRISDFLEPPPPEPTDEEVSRMTARELGQTVDFGERNS